MRWIFAHWERPVATLKRISIGTLTLEEDLEEGQIRELTEEEISGLKSITKLN